MTPAAILDKIPAGHEERFLRAAPEIARYGLAAVFAWIGAMKFTTYEAEAIAPLVGSHPALSWLQALFSNAQIAGLIGATELIAAALLIAGAWRPVAGAFGALLAALTLLVTSTLLLTAPVIEPSLGFPALNVLPGQFLLKDVALFGLALWLGALALDQHRR